MTSTRTVNSTLVSGEQAELSEPDSDASSIDVNMKPPSPASREQLIKRMESLVQENRVLKIELDALKIRVKTLTVENKMLKEASVQIQVKAEQEEEYISNTLLKKIKELKKEKEALALNYEQEEECLTNDLSRKLYRLRQEKEELSSTLHQEQESMVAKLVKRIKKLEAETNAKQLHLEQLRREKIELENTLEQEQEALVNRLWKRLDNLEAEKQFLQRKLDQPVTAPPSPMDLSAPLNVTAASEHTPSSGGQPPPKNRVGVDVPPAVEPAGDNPMLLARDIVRLRGEVMHLRQQLRISQVEHAEKTAQFAREEQQIREENSRLQKRLQLEIERREQLCQNLSESESSLEVVVDDERVLNSNSAPGSQLEVLGRRRRTSSRNQAGGGAYSPMQVVAAPCYVMRPISPASADCSTSKHFQSGASVVQTPSAIVCPSAVVGRCPSCGFQILQHTNSADDPPSAESQQLGSKQEKFIKPAVPSAASPRNNANASAKSPSCDSRTDSSPKK